MITIEIIYNNKTFIFNSNFEILEYFKSLDNNIYKECNKKIFKFDNINPQSISLIKEYIETENINNSCLNSNIINDLLFFGYQELLDKINNLDSLILIKNNVITKNEIIINILENNYNELVFENNITFSQFINSGDCKLLKENSKYGFIHMIPYINDKHIKTKVFDLCDINLKSFFGTTVLMDACYNNNNIEIIKEILKFKPNIELKDNNNHFSALIGACRNNNLNVIKLLIVNKANINIADFYNFTPLIYAIISQNIDLINFLINNNCSTNIITITHLTPLHFACFNSNLEIVKILLKHQKNINYQYDFYNTPLMIACEHNDYSIVEEILKYNPDITITNEDDCTAEMLTNCRDIKKLFYNFKKNV